jgi:hypothetical protein
VLRSLLARGFDWPDIHYQIAQLHKLRGRAEDARSHLYSAMRVNPQFEEAKQLLEQWAA